MAGTNISKKYYPYISVAKGNRMDLLQKGMSKEDALSFSGTYAAMCSDGILLIQALAVNSEDLTDIAYGVIYPEGSEIRNFNTEPT